MHLRRHPPAVLATLLSLFIVLAAFWLRVHAIPTVPFGWHMDEAAHGLEARDLLSGQAWPIFFSQFTGHEAMFIYLEAGAFALWGQATWVGNLVSALTGVLTVALTIALGQTLWPGARGRRVGQWAALLLAVSLWHLIESRNGYRAILEPLVQLPAIIFLVKALRAAARAERRAWLWWGLCGLFTGLNLHTYLAARAFPLVIGLMGSLAVLVGPHRRRLTLGLALALGVVCLLALPLAIHFYLRPIDFYGRATQISLWTVGGNPWQLLWKNLQDTAGMFTVRGDSSYKYNLAGRPVFDPVVGGLFFLGAAWLGLNGFRRRTWLVSATLLSWTLSMLLPMLLSAQGLPNFLRAIGILPAIMFAPALIIEAGWAAVDRRVVGRLNRPYLQTLWQAAVLLPFAWLTFSAQQTYFTQWHNAPANDLERVVQMVYLEKNLRPRWRGEPLYVSTSYPENVTLAFLNPAMFAKLHDFDGRQAVPLPPPGQSTDYYILLEDTPNPALLQKAGLTFSETVSSRLGQPVYDIYRWAGQWPTPAYTAPMSWSWDMQFPAAWHATPIAAPVNFDDHLSLLGYDLTSPAPQPGETVVLTLYWVLAGPAPREYSMFAHVLNSDSQVVSGADGNRYPATRWHAGELLLSEFVLPLSADTPAGTYQLEVGVYHQPTGERLFIVTAGTPIADRLLLQPLIVK